MLHHAAPALGGLGTLTGFGLIGGGALFFCFLALSLEKPGVRRDARIAHKVLQNGAACDSDAARCW